MKQVHGITEDRRSADGIMPEQVAYSVPRAAELLDMQERYVWDLVRREEIRSFKVGGLRRIARKDLLAFVDRMRDKEGCHWG